MKLLEKIQYSANALFAGSDPLLITRITHLNYVCLFLQQV